MRALVQHRYGGAGDLELEDLPVPDPEPGQVRVRVLACGANASDWEFVTARPAYARAYGLFRSGRRVLGSDVAGRIDAVGDGVTGLVPGQIVLADTFGHFGGFADYVAAPAALWVPVPDGIDLIAAAALPQSGTIALSGMADRASAGDRVLINGAGGGSGTLALQMALAAGADVTVVDKKPKLEMLRKLGARRLIDYQETDFTRLPDRYDLILDLFGTRRVRDVRKVLAPAGRYFWIGGSVRALWSLYTAGTATSLFTDQTARLLVVSQGPDRLAELLQMLASGSIDPVIGEISALEDAAAALARMGAGGISGKLVIKP